MNELSKEKEPQFTEKAEAKKCSPIFIHIMDSKLLSSLQGEYSLAGYTCGHDILEVTNDHYALQLWVNTMYGVELECNFGKKLDVEPDSTEYEFDYLDSFDMEEYLPTPHPLDTFLELFEHALTTVSEKP